MTSNADYIIGGATDFANVMQKKQDEEAPLTPTQKWMSEMLQGKISPEEAATRAKIEHIQTGVPFHDGMAPPGMPTMSQAKLADSPTGQIPPRTGMVGNEISNPFPSRAPESPPPEVDASTSPPSIAPNQQQGMFPTTPQGGMTSTTAPPLMRLNYGPTPPLPANNKEYGQLLEGAKLFGLNRASPNPNTLTFAQRQELQKEKYGPQGIQQLISQKGSQASDLQDKKSKSAADRAQTRADAAAAIADARNSTALKISGARNATSKENAQLRSDTIRDTTQGKDALTQSVQALSALKNRASSLEAARAKILSSMNVNDPAVKKSLAQIDQDLARVRGAAAFHVDNLEKLSSTPDEVPGGEPDTAPAGEGE